MSEVTALEEQLSAAKELVALREKAQKLARNKEFRELILDGFCTKDAARLVAQSADPVLDKNQREDALAMAQAGGHLKRYLSMIIQMGNTAEREVHDIGETLDEVRAESGDAE